MNTNAATTTIATIEEYWSALATRWLRGGSGGGKVGCIGESQG